MNGVVGNVGVEHASQGRNPDGALRPFVALRQHLERSIAWNDRVHPRVEALDASDGRHLSRRDQGVEKRPSDRRRRAVEEIPAVDDADEIVGRQHQEKLTAEAETGPDVQAVPVQSPPLIAVAQPLPVDALDLDGGRRGSEVRIQNALAVPDAALEVEIPDLGQLFGLKVEAAFGVGVPLRRLLPVIVVDSQRPEEMGFGVCVDEVAGRLPDDAGHQVAAAAVVDPLFTGRGVHRLVEGELDPVVAPFELQGGVGVVERPVLLVPLDAGTHREQVRQRRPA